MWIGLGLRRWWSGGRPPSSRSGRSSSWLLPTLPRDEEVCLLVPRLAEAVAVSLAETHRRDLVFTEASIVWGEHGASLVDPDDPYFQPTWRKVRASRDGSQATVQDSGWSWFPPLPWERALSNVPPQIEVGGASLAVRRTAAGLVLQPADGVLPGSLLRVPVDRDRLTITVDPLLTDHGQVAQALRQLLAMLRISSVRIVWSGATTSAPDDDDLPFAAAVSRGGLEVVVPVGDVELSPDGVVVAPGGWVRYRDGQGFGLVRGDGVSGVVLAAGAAPPAGHDRRVRGGGDRLRCGAERY